MNKQRIFQWTAIETCPTCGNTDTDKINRVHNGRTYDSRRLNALVREGCECEICGAMWHQWVDSKTDEHLVKEIIQEGDLYAD